MKSKLIFILLYFIVLDCWGKSPEDLKLEKIIEVYSIKACQKIVSRGAFNLGEKLFKSKELSGERDVSCETCHLEGHGFSDGIPIAVGVGGEGESEERLYSGKGALVQRNAFSLFDRGHPLFSNFFWDGKIDSEAGVFYSPFGSEVSSKFNSALSIAAILPITERDEFLGQFSAVKDNDLRHAVGDLLYQDKYNALSIAISKRVWANKELSFAAKELVLNKDEFDLADVGNALADFISVKFSCPPSRWQKYLQGEKNALTQVEKHGAVAFFGKGRCAGCHTPPLFSDFKYHSIGVAQGDFGPHTRVRDLGRAGVTNNSTDLYLFRTPPLVAVKDTSPYGHNGSFATLESIVVHHVNPISFFLQNPDLIEGNDKYRLGRYLDVRSEMLKFIEISSDEDLKSIVSFLETL